MIDVVVNNSKTLCIVLYFVEIHGLRTELGEFEARIIANFGTQCIGSSTRLH